MQLHNRILVVTGGGNGLGQELVLQMLTKGATIAAVDINAEGLQETEARAGDRAHHLSLHQCDITHRDSVNALAQEVLECHGGVDGIVNNAGIIHRFEPVTEMSFDTIDKVLQVNLFGMINVTKAFLPHLQSRPEAHIVNISSMGGLFAFPQQTLYGASKAAVKLFTEGLFVELRETTVSVTVVFPGAIATNLTRNCDAHTEKIDRLNRLVSGTPPAKAAAKVIRAIEKRRFRIHVGLDAQVLSMLYRLAPKTTILLINRAIRLAMG